MNVLVTGASGFVGHAVVGRLVAAGHHVRAAVRRRPAPAIAGIESMQVGDIDGASDWTRALAGIDAVVHLAARVHMLDDRRRHPDDVLAASRRIHRDGTRALARACGPHVRFVLMSSIRAVVDESHPTPVDAHTRPQPTTAYGITKLEAEHELACAARERGFSWIALRPPLVLGEGVGGNLQRLVRSIDRGLPLPLAAVHNRRSTIYVGNLADAVVRALAPAAPHGVALPLTDGPPHSTAALAREIGRAISRPARLLAVPPRWLELGARALGRTDVWARLCADLEIAEHSAAALDWRPAISFAEAVRRSVRVRHGSE